MKKIILIIIILSVSVVFSFADVRDCQIDLNRYLKKQQNPGIIFGSQKEINDIKYLQFLHKGLRVKLEKKNDTLLTVAIYTPKNYFNDKKSAETEGIFSSFGMVLYYSEGFCIDDTIIEYLIIQNKKIVNFGYQKEPMAPAEWRKTRIKNYTEKLVQDKLAQEKAEDKAFNENLQKELETEKALYKNLEQRLEANNKRVEREKAEQDARYKAQRDRMDNNEKEERNRTIIENEAKKILKKIKLW